MSRLEHTQALPAKNEVTKWYTEFWPWFILILLSTVVCASLFTVYIAFKYADKPIKDNSFSKSALVAENNHTGLQRVQALQLQVKLNLNVNSITVKITANATKLPTVISAFFIHPFDAKQDFALDLHSNAQHSLTAELPQNLRGRWFLMLEDPQDSWQLKTVINDIGVQQLQDLGT